MSGRTVAIGIQNFKDLIQGNCFYVDKTDFIREWWENQDAVTLITRPRRFGKTLTLNTVDYFFSIDHADDRELFDGLKIFEEEKYRNLQGTYPVISISFASVKDISYHRMYGTICMILYNVLKRYIYIFDEMDAPLERKLYEKTLEALLEAEESSLIPGSLQMLSELLATYYGKRVIILLDEYDTPMQEAYVNSYWDEAVSLFRNLFNATFKSNEYVQKSLITGITRISKESLFSDLNNLEVVTTTSEKYETAFGFTEEEVFAAMNEYGMTNKDEMKRWYDGFTFGNTSDIYNPWSVINALDKKKYATYWVNTSSNGLINKIMKQGSAELKMQIEELLRGNSITCYFDEEIVYNQLDTNINSVWSLMVATGYLKVEKVEFVGRLKDRRYTLRILNLEVEKMLNDMVSGWFKDSDTNYNDFIKALLLDDVEAMNEFMNDIALASFSAFDTAKKTSGRDAPERFYHGFVLGLMVELDGRYEIKSNRESGFGRYDIMLRPLDLDRDKAYIIEFKVKKKREESIEETLKNAHAQIEEKKYAQELITSGIPEDRIRKYAFAFEGKTVLIG
jgi:hypothetical protein